MYQVLYIEPNAQWEPAKPERIERILGEMQDRQAAIDWMQAGNDLRTNFAWYRIEMSELSPAAQVRQCEYSKASGI